jgi:hypothetical protein
MKMIWLKWNTKHFLKKLHGKGYFLFFLFIYYRAYKLCNISFIFLNNFNLLFQPIQIVSHFPSSYPEFIEPRPLNIDTLNSILRHHKLNTHSGYTGEAATYYSNLKENSIPITTDNKFPNIKILYGEHFQRSNSSQLIATSFGSQEAFIETNIWEQKWANKELISIQQNGLVGWLDLQDNLKIGKVISYNESTSKVHKFKEIGGIYQQMKSTVEILRSNIILSGDLLTKQSKLRKSTTKTAQRYLQLYRNM